MTEMMILAVVEALFRSHVSVLDSKETRDAAISRVALAICEIQDAWSADAGLAESRAVLSRAYLRCKAEYLLS